MKQQGEFVLPEARRNNRFEKGDVVVCFVRPLQCGVEMLVEKGFYEGKITAIHPHDYLVIFRMRVCTGKIKKGRGALFEQTSPFIMTRREFTILKSDSARRTRWVYSLRTHMERDNNVRSAYADFIDALSKLAAKDPTVM